MKTMLIKTTICILLFVQSLTDAAEPYTLDLTDISTKGITWKDVFDMGFRPSGASGTSAGLRHEAVVTVKNGNKSFDLFPGSVSFTVFGGKNLVDTRTLSKEEEGYLTYEEAARQLRSFAEVFSNYEVVKPQLQPKTYYEEDRFFDSFSSGIRPDAMNGYSVVYALRRSGNKQKPFREMFFVSMGSKEMGRKRIRATVAEIVPPEGYEHVSLDPKVVDKEFLEAQEKKREAYAKKSDAEFDRESEKPNILLWLCLGIFGAIVFLGFLLLKRTSK